MGQANPSFNNGINKSSKQEALGRARFRPSSPSKKAPPPFALELKRSHSWGTSSDDKKFDFYEQALGKVVAELGRARETERQKIANDLHDHIGQNLVLALMKLRTLERSVGKNQTSRVHEIHQLINEVVGETRSLVFDLCPPVLRDLGLRAALEWLVERVDAAYGLNCVAEIISMPKSLARDVAETLFQAVRELLINVAKHARAKQARVIFREMEGSILIQVVDDGQGFERGRISVLNPELGGFGLLSMREHLALLGGHMHIDSAPGQGTKITITVPADTCAQA
jgi:signal transduction histidine kinase